MVLDEQHKKTIGMMNSIVPSDESPVDQEVLCETLAAMTQCAKQHFKEEERLMKEHGYPGLEGQRSQHKHFLLKTMDFCRAESLQVVGVPDKLRTYLGEWWTHHILEEDMKYKPFFQQRGVR